MNKNLNVAVRDHPQKEKESASIGRKFSHEALTEIT